MKTIMRNLTGTVLVVAAVLGTGPTQSTAQEIRLSDIRAQQPQEAIYASAPCQRARETPRGHIDEHYAIDPRTLVQDLNTLIAKSDEVILAGTLDSAVVISPSGESTAHYREVRVIRSWKGPHHAGDTLTFGMPGGVVDCKPGGLEDSHFSVLPASHDWRFPARGPLVYVLFLRQSKDDETKLVQGLRLAAGEGVQGMFLIQVPAPLLSDAEKYCAGALNGNVQHCDSYLETSKSPVMDPYARDPLAKKYVGMPASDFLREVLAVADGQ